MWAVLVGARGLVLLCLVVTLPACAASTRSEPERQWTARANAICDEWDHRVHKLGTATTLPRVAFIARHAAVLAQRYVERLRALPPPSGHSADAQAALSSLARSERALEDLAKAAASGDQEAVDRAGTALRIAFRTADRHIVRLGAHQCLSDDG
jgi:hypothetical protein